MARIGGRNQMKRLAAPRAMKIERKGVHARFISKAEPGPHPRSSSLPIIALLRDILGLARSAREIKMVLSQGKVLVDGTVRRDHRFPIGFMDVVSIPDSGINYRIKYDTHGRLVPVEVSKNEASFKYCKIMRKSIIRGGSLQYGFHDGRTITAEKSAKMSLGDVVKLEIPEQKILKVLPLKEGSLGYITSGKHAGKTGKIVQITTGGLAKKPSVLLEGEGEKFSTNKENVFVVEEARK
jgi:small subunit ribosomal protein S4e